MKRLALVVLLLAAACGQGKSAMQIISGAPAAAAARGSAKVSLESVVRISGQGQSFSTITRGDGVSELGGARRGRMKLTVSTIPSAGSALRPCEMVTQGAVVYLKTSEGWLSVDIAKVAGVDPSALSSDPSGQLDYLKSVNRTVKDVGSQDIRGTKTTHYRYTVNVSQFLAKLPAKTREQVQSALKGLDIRSFPLDTWIDADGLPRRVAFHWKTAKEGATLDMSTQVDTYDYGTKVSVPTPANAVRASNPTSAFTECFGAPAGSIGGVPGK